MKPSIPTARGTFQRLADPGNFQPFVIITKEGLHARVPSADRIQLPPDPESDWLHVYLTAWPKMVSFREIERIEFAPELARKPVRFARQLRAMRFTTFLLGVCWGLAFGINFGWVLDLVIKHAKH